MNVAELIDALKALPQDMTVLAKCVSEIDGEVSYYDFDLETRVAGLFDDLAEGATFLAIG